MLNIRFDVEDTVITATLDDNATSRDFVSLLPLTLTLEDYAATEKVGDLPRRLSTERAPSGVEPATGDVAYYAPWAISRSSTGTSGIQRVWSGSGNSTLESKLFAVLDLSRRG